MVKHVPSNDQVAYILTKSVSKLKVLRSAKQTRSSVSIHSEFEGEC